MSLQSRFKKPPVPQTVIQFSGPRLMSPKQGAEYIGHSIDLVYEMIQSGELPFVKKGNGIKKTQYLLDRLDLDVWVEKNKERNPEIAA